MDYRVDSLAIVISQHLRLLKQIVASGEALPTREEALRADYLTDVIEHSAGRRLANCCRRAFTDGWMSHDAGTYSLRKLLTDFRSWLCPGKAKDELSARLDEIVAQAMAFVTEVPARRTRKAEKTLRPTFEQLVLFDANGEPCPSCSYIEVEGDSEEMPDVGITEDDLDDVELSVRPKALYGKPARTVRVTRRMPKKDALERLTAEILKAEYEPSSEESDTSVDEGWDTDGLEEDNY